MLRDSYRDVNRDLQRLATNRTASAAVRRQQLLQVKQTLLLEQAKVFARTGKIIEQRRVEAAARSIRLTAAADLPLFELAGRASDHERITDELLSGNERGIDLAIARMTGSHVPLSQRVYRTEVAVGRQLDRRINSALARGLTAQEMAREMREFINPSTPGGVRYAALRLARTEINNALHAMAIEAARNRPWITALEWHTSRSHPRPDECDNLRGKQFKPDEVPRKPHPQCFCCITPVTQDDDDFIDAIVNGEYDHIIGAA